MENEQPVSNSLPVRDLSVSSYLMATGEVKLIKVERSSEKIAFFHFQPKEEAERLVADYWADRAKNLQPRQLFAAQRDLKDLIFSGN